MYGNKIVQDIQICKKTKQNKYKYIFLNKYFIKNLLILFNIKYYLFVCIYINIPIGNMKNVKNVKKYK